MPIEVLVYIVQSRISDWGSTNLIQDLPRGCYYEQNCKNTSLQHGLSSEGSSSPTDYQTFGNYSLVESHVEIDPSLSNHLQGSQSVSQEDQEYHACHLSCVRSVNALLKGKRSAGLAFGGFQGLLARLCDLMVPQNALQLLENHLGYCSCFPHRLFYVDAIFVLYYQVSKCRR